MPTAALHSAYWKSRAAGPAPETGASGAGGYVPWQTTVVIGGGFGVMQVAWEWARNKATQAWPKPKKG